MAYRDLFLEDIPAITLKNIRHNAEFSMPVGGHNFQQQIEQAHDRKLGYANPGRSKNLVEDQ
ncbi:MAG: hypothetical protein COC05_03940 [Gammaproteobacteria bacterium]|nr:MAG: hypothetical protein COC05_03940 [Gammaproteobacteria bacterium]